MNQLTLLLNRIHPCPACKAAAVGYAPRKGKPDIKDYSRAVCDKCGRTMSIMPHKPVEPTTP